MTRTQVIEGALTTYLDGHELSPISERIEELARFIDAHLGPQGETSYRVSLRWQDRPVVVVERVR